MSRCPTCGQECGEPMIAILRDHGFDPLEHCFFLAYYSGKIRECAGRDNPKILRCCNLCPVSKVFGAWMEGAAGQPNVHTRWIDI